MITPSRITVLCILTAFTVGSNDTRAADTPIVFNRDIRPILSDNCFHCHGPDHTDRKADLRLDTQADAFAEINGTRPIVPGDPNDSEVFLRIIADNPDDLMPPPESNKKLTTEQIDLIKKWIGQGATYQDHWAFVAPISPPVPEDVAGANPIDRFIHARLNEEGLPPSPEADRATLIRRVTFDLTGLPPTPTEIDAFINDKSPKAYEKVVDRLLASPRYGERMALAWMDAARYGDTSVYHADGPRDMWPWRDWVINAYNSNMPFDQFTVEQLAGDLLPDSTVSQKTASGFHRNHGTSDEGGAIDEEYRVEYIVDRVKTTGNVWLGLSVECAQCHEHKYDPLSQKEYYQLFAFFNQTNEKGMQTRRGNATPLVKVPSMADEQKLEELNTQLRATRQALNTKRKNVGQPYHDWLAEIESNPEQLNTAPANPLIHLPFNSRDGAKTVNKASANPADQGEIKGKPLWVDGKINAGLRFDGSNFVNLGWRRTNFKRTAPFSYGAWVKPATNAAGAVLARMDEKDKHRGYDLYVANYKVSAHFINQWPTNAIKVTTKKAIPKDKWSHLFVTYDGSSKAGGVKIYVNGVAQALDTNTDTLTGQIDLRDTTFHVGRRNTASKFKGLIDEVYVYNRKLSDKDVASLASANPIAPILKVAAAKRTGKQVSDLKDYYLSVNDPQYQKQLDKLTQQTTRYDNYEKNIPTVMVMEEQAAPRKTYILSRGQYDSPIKDEVIYPGTPDALPPMPGGAPPNRLGLAQWITMPENPLTARVAVNRYWQMFFGEGIVTSVMDFGSQGQWPSHPELLDWLAVDFVESGWDVKRAIKQMVMSHAYRQTSRVTPQLVDRDPLNTLLARGPRFRLQGEFIRDQALAASGLLVERVGGPGVKPYQPPGLWNEVSLTANVRFVQDAGDKLYRRSMYTYWKRSAPQPAMRIFDAPTREKCVVQRQRTNTPLQALVLLNDTQFVEAARALAQRVMLEKNNLKDQIDLAYRLVTAHHPNGDTRDILIETYRSQLERFTRDTSAAEQLLDVGESERETSIAPAQHAALTIVTSMILNLDQAITRG
ncbi:MAG: DUF1553 domain-containing protein [Planctomycetota bacterium]|jgi:hypothetical protein